MRRLAYGLEDSVVSIVCYQWDFVMRPEKINMPPLSLYIMVRRPAVSRLTFLLSATSWLDRPNETMRRIYNERNPITHLHVRRISANIHSEI